MKLLPIIALNLLFIAGSLHTSEKNDIPTAPPLDKETKEKKYEKCRNTLLELASPSLFASPSFKASPLPLRKTTYTQAKPHSETTIVGSGITVTKQFYSAEPWAITGIHAECATGILKIRTGAKDRVFIQGDANIVPYFLISSHNNDLSIVQHDNTKFITKDPCIITIQFCSSSLALLTSIRTTMATYLGCPLAAEKLLISMSGNKTLTAYKKIAVDGELLVAHTGKGNMSFRNIYASKLTVDKSSTGQLSITGGNVDVGKFSILAGSVLAAELTVNTLKIKLLAQALLQCRTPHPVRGVLSGHSSFVNFGDGDMTHLHTLKPAQYFKVIRQ